MDDINVVRFKYFFAPLEKLAYEGGILSNLKQHPWTYLLLPFFFAAQTLAIFRLLKRNPFDLIHAHWIIPQGLTAILGKRLACSSCPIVCTSHGGDLLGLNGWIISTIKRLVIRKVNRLTVVSSPMVAQATKLGAKLGQVTIIPMGVDLVERFIPKNDRPRGSNSLLYVGRLVEKKGVEYLLRAMPAVLREFPDVQLTLIGDGPQRGDLKMLTKGLGIEHAVIFKGSIVNEELPSAYQTATLLIMPSIITSQGDQEGLGLVLIEALGCHCPVVASAIPAIKDIVIDGVTGLLCQPENETDIAQKIGDLLKNPTKGAAMAYAGKKHVMEYFDWQGVVDRYKSIYISLL